MTAAARRRTAVAVAAGLLAVSCLAGCGESDGPSTGTGTATTGPSDLAEMQKLVDAAESAAAEAESAAADDGN
ncbi:hypothetical protein [Streptomyces sp. NPDC020681]|uniref:hypothetical protein n=1 Tax=Streptomyces sp. NPDC020681 TaxID=3365083 RepID=UPI0037AB9BBA